MMEGYWERLCAVARALSIDDELELIMLILKDALPAWEAYAAFLAKDPRVLAAWRGTGPVQAQERLLRAIFKAKERDNEKMDAENA